MQKKRVNTKGIFSLKIFLVIFLIILLSLLFYYNFYVADKESNEGNIIESIESTLKKDTLKEEIVPPLPPSPSEEIDSLPPLIPVPN